MLTEGKIEIVVRQRRINGVVVEVHQATVNCLTRWSVGVISRDGNWTALGQYESRDAAFARCASYAG